jgi:hypothetical protein
MSRGLGKLQREILDALEPAAKWAATALYTGKGYRDGEGNVRARSRHVTLKPGVYDLRATLRYMAKQRGATYANGSFVNNSFQASFSRAARGLVERGYLTEYSLVPIENAERVEEYDSVVLSLADGLYVDSGHQLRFVAKTENIHNAYVST